MGDDEPRRIDLPERVVLTVAEAFDVADALESAQVLADRCGDIETGVRTATALSIVWRALGVA